MTGADEKQDRDYYCGAKKRGSEGFCGLRAGWGTDHPGVGRCKLHGGSTGAHRRNAQLVRARRDVEAWGGREDVSPPEALLDLVRSKAAEVAYWEERVAGLSDVERAGVMVHRVEERGLSDVVVRQAGTHVWLVLLHEAQDQLAQYAAAAIRAGADRALVEFASMQAAWLVPVLRRAVLAGCEAGRSGLPVVDELVRDVLGIGDAA